LNLVDPPAPQVTSIKRGPHLPMRHSRLYRFSRPFAKIIIIIIIIVIIKIVIIIEIIIVKIILIIIIKLTIIILY
jgi:hypothetical protein